VIPHTGFGYTSYWDIDNGLSSFDRTLLQTGVDTSIKFAKRYDSVVSKEWGVDGLLHSIQPYLNYTVLHTDDPDATFRSVERLTPSTEIRPIKVGRFSAIDELSQWSIIRLGIRNTLLTRRDDLSHPWLTMNNYIDVFIDDPEFNRDFTNFYNEVDWHPLPWIKLDLNAQFPVGNEKDGFGEYSTGTTFMPSNKTELSVNYRYLTSHPSLEDSSRIEIRADHRFNEKWGASIAQRWELDDGTLESHRYSIHRDLGSWTSSLGFIQKDNRIKDEVGLMLSFTLKELPTISLPFSIDTE
jgi:LPS-assembly protein